MLLRLGAMMMEMSTKSCHQFHSFQDSRLHSWLQRLMRQKLTCKAHNTRTLRLQLSLQRVTCRKAWASPSKRSQLQEPQASAVVALIVSAD